MTTDLYIDYFNFLFNNGRGIRTDQVDWSVSDTELTALLSSLGGGSGGGNNAFILSAVPADTFGADDDIAVVRYSPLALRGYKKESGTWVRQWTFHGGEAVLLTGSLSGIVADQVPATDPDASFSRVIGLSGYSPVTDADIDDAERVINDLADWRGGNHGTKTGSINNTLPNQDIGTNLDDVLGIQVGATVPIYLWFGLERLSYTGLSLTAVTYDGTDIPITKQADLGSGSKIMEVWVSDSTYLWDAISEHPFELTLTVDAAAPNTYNRYAVVTDDPTPTAADFLSDDATASPTISILIPNAGWEDGRGYLHFALPATQDAPTLAGLPGGINLISDFVVRSATNTVTINGDAMRTVSSDSPVFQMYDQYSLFAWIVR